MKWLCLLLAIAAAFAGCGGGGGSGTQLKPGATVEGFEFSGDSEVAEGERIDQRFTCDGEDVSPALAWRGVPDGAEELALLLEDPDAPGATFTHWLVYGLDPGVDMIGADEQGWTGYGPKIVREGENDFGDVGYGGPCPPGSEEHRYVFRLLALHAPLELQSSADRAAFDEAVAPHVFAEARLMATYARP